MKRFKKMMAIVVVAVMTMMYVVPMTAFAQTKALNPASGDGATITINNPSNGETYNVHKLFDATVATDGTISYKSASAIPAGLTGFFERNATTGYVTPKDSIAVKDSNGKITGTTMTDELKAALETWATDSNITLSDTSNGDGELKFTGLPYGYYVMTTTHKSDAAEGETAKALISVTSTTPNAVINDKNVNEPTANKEADKESYSIGDTITYTATFDAPNYMEDTSEGAAEGASKQVVSYTIKDTLPAFLTDVDITSVKVDQPSPTVDVTLTDYSKFNSTDKSITIPWVNEYPNNYPTDNHEYTSTYKAGSKIIITYTAKLNSNANIGAGNTNKVSIMPNVDNGTGDTPEPYQEEDEWNDEETIYTYATALKKVDGSSGGAALTGAKFQFKGLTLATGQDTPGVYTVVSYDSSSNNFGTEVEVGSNGTLTIVGLAKNVTLVGKETKAPEGYNQLDGTFDLPAIELGSTTTQTWGSSTTKYDADGNVVDTTSDGGVEVKSNYKSVDTISASSIKPIINNKGTELPSTGGIGTTMFYLIGAILIIGAGILLVTRRRMSAEE